jgi:ABC-type transport system involved in multi-copper enzyme maturation permease subunit
MGRRVEEGKGEREMFWHIAKREIYDNMTSLRFGFTVVLLVLLMTINAVIFVRRDYRKGVDHYKEKTAESLAKLKTNCSSLYKLMTDGPGDLYKEPSPLTFCADGEEDNIPNVAWTRVSWGRGSWGYNTKGLWCIDYRSSDFNQLNIMPGYLKTDWAFIVGVLISFVAILFTFDTISGERQRGTLRLVLAGTVPRSSIILGKFVGAFVSIMLPLSIAILLNLLIINVSGTVQLTAAHWGRIGVMMLISIVYTAVFVCLGIFVSSLCSRSRTSLLILLLVWVVFVVVTPNIVGSIASGLKEVPSMEEVSRRNQVLEDMHREHDNRMMERLRARLAVAPSRENPDMEVMKLWADYLARDHEFAQRLIDQHLHAKLAQVQLARQITRISPTSIYRYALEKLSNTGFERHRKFVANVRAYRDGLWEYIKSEDRVDPNSLHIYFVREGISDKPPNFDSAPRFTERQTLVSALQDALLDIAVLAFLAVFFFMAAYVSFMRTDVR